MSVVSQSFYNDNLSQITIQPLTNILNIECADGNNLPYTGYIEVEISTGEDLPKANSHTCLLLVTPDTKFSERTPVILGTNILNELLKECKSNFGEQFLQRAKMFTPWFLCFRTIVLREKELTKNKNRIGLIRSAVAQKVF